MLPLIASGSRPGARRFGGPERPKIDPSRLASRSDRPFRPTKSPQVRSKRALRSTWPPEMARRCTIFGVHQADSPKRVLRFRPVIAEHPILCEDIDMGRYAELRRVRWAGSLSSIICKTNVFTKEKWEKVQLFHVCTRLVLQKNSPKKSLNGSKLDEIWELEDEKKYVSNEFSRGIRFRAQKLKIPSIFVGIIFWQKNIFPYFYIFLTENHKIDLPLLGELGQTSRDPWRIGSESSESRDVWPNSFKSGFFNFSISSDFLFFF